MQKRAVVISLEALVKLVPHLLITILLLAVLVTMYGIFIAEKKSMAEQDFQRVLSEIDEIVKTPHPGYSSIIRVPISDAQFKIVAYPAKDADNPTACNKQACICLYENKGGKLRETCKIYTEMSRCQTDQCGVPCIKNKQVFTPALNILTIDRECHEINLI